MRLAGPTTCVLLALAVPVTANEALDLLEQQTVGPGSSGYYPSEPATGVSPATPAKPSNPWDPDYSYRWMTHLPPLWSFYRDEGNSIIQEAALTGLFEWRYEMGTVNPDGGDREDEDIDSGRSRRARLGTVLRAFYNTDIEAGVVFDDATYEGIDKLKATVHLGDDLALSFGKFRPPFSLENTYDPGTRIVPEMSQLAAQLAPANSLGVMASGHAGNWDWRAGWFSGDRDENLPGVDGSGYLLASIGYLFQGDTGKPPVGEDAPGGPRPHSYQRWHLDYIYNIDDGGSGSIPGGYTHLLSTGIRLSEGRLDFLGDFLLGNGEDASTAWGVTLQGSYWLMDDAVRLVARYHYADTDDEAGLLSGWGIPSPKSDTLQAFQYPVVRTGDELHSFYGGLNFHVFGDYLLLQTGLEYRILKNNESMTQPDYDSWLWQAGGRAAF